MIDFEGLNYFAVAVAWLITVVIGGFWYSPAGFGKQWSKLSGVDMMKTPKAETGRAIRFVAISCLLQVLALALILNSLNVENVLQGLIASLVIWFGFTALTTVGNTLYQRQSWRFWWLNASYFLVVMVINGIILSAWQ
jgi:hypothetical protein